MAPFNMGNNIVDELALIDELTGVYNRRAFNRYLKTLTKEAEDNSWHLLLVVIDIDHFKYVNDTYGHVCGDNLIVSVANLLTNSVRGMDIVCRYGGDEFVILFPRATKNIVQDVAERIRKEIESNKFLTPDEKEKLNITVSIGYASFPDEANNAEDLLQEADKALYASKDLGRNTVSGISEVTAKIQKMNLVKMNIYKPPFVVHLKEFERVKEMLIGANKKRRVVLTKGVRGVGKTRFIEELKAYAQEKGNRTLLITPNQIEQTQPYQLLAEELIKFAGIEHDFYVEMLDKLEKEHRKTLQSFMPELVLQDSKKITKQQEVEKQELFSAFCELLVLFSESSDLIFFIDNIHWLDDATLDVLRYLVVSEDEINISVCGGYCVDDTKKEQSGTHLFEWISDITEVEIIPEIEIPAISYSDTKIFIQSLFDQKKVRDEFVHSMYDITQGNLLFLLELISYLGDKEIIHIVDDAWSFDLVHEEEIPKSFKDLIHKRFEELNPEIQEILTISASMGQDFNFTLLSKLQETNEGYLFDIIDKTQDAHIMQTVMEIAGEKVHFMSDGLREEIYLGLDTDVRKDVHTQIGNYVENEYKGKEGSVSAALAYHFEKAEAKQKALGYAKMVAERADSIFSNKEIMCLFEKMLKEREERDQLAPIEEEVLPLINEFIRNFIVAIWNIRIYPPENKMVIASKEEACVTLEKIFASKDRFTISAPVQDTVDVVLINGYPLKATDAHRMFYSNFVTIIKDCNVSSISLKRGVTADELKNFIELLSGYESIADQDIDWKDLLKQREIHNISADEIRYKRVYSDQEKKEQRKEILENLAYSGAIIDSPFAGGEENTEQDQEKANKKVTGDVERLIDLVKDILENPSTKKIELLQGKLELLLPSLEDGKTVMRTVQKHKYVSSLSSIEVDVFSQMLEFVPDEVVIYAIVELYKRSAGSIEKIKVLVDKVLAPSNRRHKISGELSGQLQESGMPTGSLMWLIDPQAWLSWSISKRSQLLLNAQPEAFVQIGLKKHIEPTFFELMQKKEYEVVAQLVKIVIGNLGSEDEEIREDVVSLVREIIKMLIGKEDIDVILNSIGETIVPYFEKEENSTVYSDLSDVIVQLVKFALKSQKYKKAKMLLGLVKKHIHRNETKYKEMISYARQILQLVWDRDFEQDLFMILCDDESEHREVVLEVASLIGKKSVPCLVKYLMSNETETMPFEVYMRQKKILQVLHSMGDDYVWEIASYLKEKQWYQVKHAVSILGSLKRDDLVEPLKLAFKQDDLRVKKELISAFQNIGTKNAVDAITIFIKDEDEEIRNVAIKFLGEVGDESTIKLLQIIGEDRKYKKYVEMTIKKIKKRLKK